MLGLSLDDMGDAYTYGEAIDHVNTLRATPGTHTHAAVSDWDYPSTFPEIATSMLTEFVHQYLSKKDAKPLQLPRPWRDVDDVTPEERDAIETEYKRRSAFAD